MDGTWIQFRSPQTGNEFATCGNLTTLKLRCHFLDMTRNKEPGKAKFHGQNLSYFKCGNKGWGVGRGGEGGGYLKDQWVWTPSSPSLEGPIP